MQAARRLSSVSVPKKSHLRLVVPARPDSEGAGHADLMCSLKRVECDAERHLPPNVARRVIRAAGLLLKMGRDFPSLAMGDGAMLQQQASWSLDDVVHVFEDAQRQHRPRREVQTWARALVVAQEYLFRADLLRITAEVTLLRLQAAPTH